MWFLRQHDQLSASRYIRLVTGRGHSLAKTLETNLNSLGYSGDKQQQHARRVVAALQTWCSRRGFPPVIEVLHRRNARAFLRNLDAKGLGRRTVENYRTVLSCLWDFVAASQAEMIRSSKRQKVWEGSTLLENPWKSLEVPKAQASSSSPKSDAATTADTQGLAKGPAATAKKARERAFVLRPTLRALSKEGIISNCGIARELNRMGERTPRGKFWDATGVRRLKIRCRWDYK
jgi:hypothetical protein